MAEPLTGMEYCPAQLLMGRMLRTTLPSLHELLQPKIPQRAHTSLNQLQEKQKKYYDWSAKPLSVFHHQDTVCNTKLTTTKDR